MMGNSSEGCRPPHNGLLLGGGPDISRWPDGVCADPEGFSGVFGKNIPMTRNGKRQV